MLTNADTENQGSEARGNENEGDYWITPVKSTSFQTAEEIIQELVGNRRAYAFGWSAHGRKALKAGDWICFYIAQKGVVGYARVISPPQQKAHDWIPRPERYPWVFELESIKLYLRQPTRFDLATRKKLEGFKGREDEENFGWFVRSTHRISKNDFNVLTNRI